MKEKILFLVLSKCYFLIIIFIFQSNLGSVSLSYQLSDQPVFGRWTIQVVAQNQVEETQFQVEEYYQTRFEVPVPLRNMSIYKIHLLVFSVMTLSKFYVMVIN